MSRNNTILLNKANKVLKLLEYKHVNLTLNYTSIDLLFPGISRISSAWEEVFKYFNEENVSWHLRVENNNFILNIFL